MNSQKSNVSNGYEDISIIFDFDGTLSDSLDVTFVGVCNIFKKAGVEPPDFLDFHRNFKTPFIEFYQSHGITASLDQLWEWYNEATDYSEITLFDDVIGALNRLKFLGVNLSLISAQPKDALEENHTLHPIRDYFGRIIGSAEHKAEEIREAVSADGVACEDAFYVGDFVTDMRDAREAGVIAVGITRGHEVEEHLVEAGADHVIEHLEGLFRVLESKNRTL